MPENILAFIDAPDPDNFLMLIALHYLNPGANIQVVLTGRPVRFHANRDHANWEWDYKSSHMAQEASAARIKNFLRHFGIRVINVYDGGIAPRTLVPHWIHFKEYYKFFDVDSLAAHRYSELEPQEDLVKLILEMGECSVAVGGPMTGLHQMIVRHPVVIPCIKEIHAMFATWGNVELMDFGGEPRGAMQFNVACDPQAAHAVLMGLDCPIYLMPTEVTRVAAIGFQNAQALHKHLDNPESDGVKVLYNLYALWYDAAVRPRQIGNPAELIFIHDMVSALSLDPAMRELIYEVVPVEITGVPYLPRDSADWGKVFMRQCDESDSHFAATGLKPGGAEIYLDFLRQIFS